MHMADALISPAVGGAVWAVSGGLIVFCARKVKHTLRDNLVPLMGVLGAFSVVLETKASGISELPFSAFVVMMLPIHLAIGIVEGLATVAVVSFVARARPEALSLYAAQADGASRSLRPVLAGLAVAAAVLGGVASWFASTHPDGLEWSIAKVSGKEEVSGAEAGMHRRFAELQEKTALLPDYGFKAVGAGTEPAGQAAPKAEPWPAVSAGTSVSGLVGGLMTLALACLAGFALRAGSRGKR